MTLAIDETVSCFATMLKHGILTPILLKKENQSDFFLNWLLVASELPDSCEVQIYNTLKMKDKASNNNNPVMGAFFLMGEPVYTFNFDEDGIVFTPLSDKYDLTFKEWKDIFLYDLRVQASLGYILRKLREIGDVQM